MYDVIDGVWPTYQVQQQAVFALFEASLFLGFSNLGWYLLHQHKKRKRGANLWIIYQIFKVMCYIQVQPPF